MSKPLSCHSIRDFDLKNWKSIFAAFKKTASCSLKQSWQPKPSPGFMPARVNVGWTAKHLCFLGEWHDKDIFNPVTKSQFNVASFCHGDVLEVFLRPEGQESYFEFHVNPNNQLLQLRFPYPDYFKKNPSKPNDLDPLAKVRVNRPCIQSNVHIEANKKRWWIAGKIPFKMIVEQPASVIRPGFPIHFSFARYDYTRGQFSPVLSNTSPHTACNFHLVHEYGTMKLV